MARLDETTVARRRLGNAVRSIGIILGLALLLGLIGWSFAGRTGLVLVVVLGFAYLWLTPKLAPAALLRWMGARELSWLDEPKLIVVDLARRAGMPKAPRVFLLPTPTLNAFAMGDWDDAAITVTSGMLQALDRREVVGVLAHELSHIVNRDLKVMNMAAAFGRLTSTMSQIGIFLLILNLPMWLMQGIGLPWLAVLLLLFAPAVSGLLQLALSRTREFDADLSAAKLTADPVGLASALDRLDRIHRRLHFWRRLFQPAWRQVETTPEILSSHPQTRQRIERLLSLRPDAPIAA